MKALNILQRNTVVLQDFFYSVKPLFYRFFLVSIMIFTVIVWFLFGSRSCQSFDCCFTGLFLQCKTLILQIFLVSIMIFTVIVWFLFGSHSCQSFDRCFTGLFLHFKTLILQIFPSFNYDIYCNFMVFVWQP